MGRGIQELEVRENWGKFRDFNCSKEDFGMRCMEDMRLRKRQRQRQRQRYKFLVEIFG